MNYCKSCGANLEQNTKKCAFCGALVANDTMQNVNYQISNENNGKSKGKSVASLVMGIVGLIFWLIPLLGFPTTIIGLIMGFLGLKGNKGTAVAGLILSALGLVLCIINSAIGAYMGATGQLYY